MLIRKKEKEITEWIKNGKKALLVSGARQVGKTFLIRECLRKEQCEFVEFNLIEQPEIVGLLASAETVDDLILRLSLFTDKKLIKGKSIIFFDEIQEYKEIVTKIKFFVEEGSFRYILSGSLLGVEITNLKSAPVGSLHTIKMYPLDFEEFLQVFNVQPKLIDSLREAFEKRVPVDEIVNKKLLDIFNLYLLIGGMPSAVMRYVETSSLEEVYEEHIAIIEQYKQDFTKYEAQDKKFYLTQVYDLIPAELSEKNKRFNFADIKQGLKFERAQDNFIWLQKAGVAFPVFNAAEPKIPLLLNEKSNLFKLFLSDVGMLTTMYGRATKIKILNGDKDINNGALYENAVAQELYAHGYKPYYFNSKKQGELDFIIEYHGEILPIEVKSGKGYTVHSALNNVLSNEDYGIKQAFVFANCNVTINEKIVYYPIYFCMFLQERDLILPKIPKVDFSQI
jgi:predicted AAA+ superfamily ATPase